MSGFAPCTEMKKQRKQHYYCGRRPKRDQLIVNVMLPTYETTIQARGSIEAIHGNAFAARQRARELLLRSFAAQNGINQN